MDRRRIERCRAIRLEKSPSVSRVEKLKWGKSPAEPVDLLKTEEGRTGVAGTSPPCFDQ